MTVPRVLVIGGGISGLATAWWLSRLGIPVELWEAAGRAGGKIRSRRTGGYLCEQAAGLLVNFRPEVDQLVREAGLEPARRGRSDDLRRYVLHGGALAEVPMRLPAMALSPLWSLRGKLRLLAEVAIPREPAEDESVARFIRRRLGAEILETAIDPFVSGTLAADPEQASADAVLPRLKALEHRYGSITLGMLVNRVLKRRRANRADTFSFQGGMGALIQALAANPGIRLRTGVRALGLERMANGWRVEGEADGKRIRAEAAQLLISTPADEAARLLSPLDRRLANLLSGIDYAPLAVVHLGMRRDRVRHPLDGTGFLVPRRARCGFNGNLWMSTLFPGRAPAGRVLLTSYLGGVRDPGAAERSDRQLQGQLLRDLAPLLGLTGDPEYLRVDRHPRGLPLYHGDYQQRCREITRLAAVQPGLHLGANYLGGVSVRERLHQGMLCADRIAAGLRHPPATRRLHPMSRCRESLAVASGGCTRGNGGD